MPFRTRHLLGLEAICRASESASSCSIPRRLSRRSRSATSRRCRRCAARPWSSLFYEASTRTRASFEIAAKRMSADFVSLSSSDQQRHQG